MSPDTPQACEIIVTGPTDDTLDRIARELVDAHLIVCANILDAPVTAIPLIAGIADYFAWIDAETSGPESTP